MLPDDAKRRRAENIAGASAAIQTQLDEHLRPIEAKERVIPYSNEYFWEVALQWLVETDQVRTRVYLSYFIILTFDYKPIQALKHPSFKKLVDVTARAPDGIVLPSRKVTCAAIINLFKQKMVKLRARLNVS